MTEFKFMRSYRDRLPPRPSSLPLPQLYTAQKHRSDQIWSPCYPAWNLMYYTCLTSLKPDRPNLLVETGAGHGCSTALLAQTLRETGLDGHVHSFEINEKQHTITQFAVAKMGLADYVTVHLGRSTERIPEVIADQPVDFAFIDSLHTTENCLAEVDCLYSNVLAAEGKFLFDNAGCGPVDVAICRLKEKYGVGGFADFPNAAAEPSGQVLWQPYQRTKPHPYIDMEGNRCESS